MESGGKRKAEGRLELEPASAFSDKREDPKIETNCGWSLLAKQNDI